jgi:hypothetical protein
LHPEYAKFRRRFWILLVIYLVLLVAMPYISTPLLTQADPLFTPIILLYAFVGLAGLVGSRFWVEKHYRDIWKQAHPIGRLGLRVQITIEGRGASNTLALPLGTVMGRLKGTDRGIYLAIRLDNPLTVRDHLGEDLELSEFVVSSRRGIRPLDEIITSKQLTFPVQILKPAIPLNFNEPSFDLSQAAYSALGEIKRL